MLARRLAGQLIVCGAVVQLCRAACAAAAAALAGKAGVAGWRVWVGALGLRAVQRAVALQQCWRFSSGAHRGRLAVSDIWFPGFSRDIIEVAGDWRRCVVGVYLRTGKAGSPCPTLCWTSFGKAAARFWIGDF